MSSDARIRWSPDGETLTASHDAMAACTVHPCEGTKYDLAAMLKELELCQHDGRAMCWEVRVNEDGAVWLAGYVAR